MTPPRLARLLATTAAVALSFLTQPGLRGDLVNDPEPPARTIKGRVELVPPGMAFQNADLIVSVEDVSVQDVRVKRLEHRKFTNVSYDGLPGSVLKFRLEGLRPEPNNRYQIRVLVDLDRNGRISTGDYRSTTPRPVFTGKDPDPLPVKAELKRE